MQKKHLHTITQEQAVMRYNEEFGFPSFRRLIDAVKLDGPPAEVLLRASLPLLDAKQREQEFAMHRQFGGLS